MNILQYAANAIPWHIFRLKILKCMCFPILATVGYEIVGRPIKEDKMETKR